MELRQNRNREIDIIPKTMLTTQEQKRYNRHIILSEVGMEGQEKLKAAKVLVIGAGGLGCPVLQYLTAAGVGTIGIVDFDRVDESNLQRQILYSTADVGKPKAEAAKYRLQQQNPFVRFEVFTQKLSSENALRIFEPFDIIVDGSDNFPTRYLVNDACILLNKPLVFGSIFKFEGQVSVFNYRHGPTYRCLYPEPPAPGDVPNCSEIGVIGVLSGIIGALQANEVIKIICGLGEVLSGKLLLLDALSLTQRILSFKPTHPTVTKLIDYELFCDPHHGKEKELTADELKQWLESELDFQLVDVREPYEYDRFNIEGENIPLSELSENLHLLSPSKPIVVHCQSGARSKKAIQLIQESRPGANLYNLKNGLLDW